MDEELKYDKCAHKTDGIMHGTVPLEDTLVCFLVLFFFCFLLRYILDHGHKLVSDLQYFQSFHQTFLPL